MAGSEKTIAAISTPQAAGGIGIVRISGADARQVAQRVFHAASGKSILTAKGYTALFGRVADRDGEFDEAVALVFAAPKSYTGEDVVELSCHGGLFLVRRLLAAVLAAGARPAEPGEFTRRAFLNGKLSLTGAEAVMDLIGAQGKQAAAAALAAKDGALGKRIHGVKETILALSAHLAAWVDYPEDDIPALKPQAFQQDLADAQQELEGLLSGFDRGKVIREGVETVLAGRPNVGKSTLMNLLSGCERSIVTDIPGTTRDVVEETVRLGDVVLRLADTAGLRDTHNPVEAAGVARTRERLKTAGLVLAVFDASEPLNEEDRNLLDELRESRAVAVINKTDLPARIERTEIQAAIPQVVELSAASGQGYEALAKAVEEALGTVQIDPAAGMLATERQKQCAMRAKDAVFEAREALRAGMTLDAVSVALDDAAAALLELTGERVTDAVLDQVFARFCVGK